MAEERRRDTEPVYDTNGDIDRTDTTPRMDEGPVGERPAPTRETPDREIREHDTRGMDTVRYDTPRSAVPTHEMTDLSGWTVDRIRWGPIVGGIFATMATMLTLTVLGLALGFEVFDAEVTATDLGTFAGIWGAAAAIIAFFIGGWIAGRSVAPGARSTGPFSGMANGAMVWATTLVFLLFLSAIGAAGALGYLGGAFDEIAQSVGVGEGVTAETIAPASQAAWGTLIALVLTLGVAMLGGLVGHAARPVRERSVA